MSQNVKKKNVIWVKNRNLSAAVFFSDLPQTGVNSSENFIKIIWKCFTVSKNFKKLHKTAKTQSATDGPTNGATN